MAGAIAELLRTHDVAQKLVAAKFEKDHPELGYAEHLEPKHYSLLLAAFEGDIKGLEHAREQGKLTYDADADDYEYGDLYREFEELHEYLYVFATKGDQVIVLSWLKQQEYFYGLLCVDGLELEFIAAKYGCIGALEWLDSERALRHDDQWKHVGMLAAEHGHLEVVKLTFTKVDIDDYHAYYDQYKIVHDYDDDPLSYESECTWKQAVILKASRKGHEDIVSWVEEFHSIAQVV